MQMLLNRIGLTLLGQGQGAFPLPEPVGPEANNLVDGAVVALVGLMIVFCVLIVISLFIAALPHILAQLSSVWPEVDEPASNTGHPDSLVADDGAVLAAIGFVLHTEFQRQLKSQDSAGRTG